MTDASPPTDDRDALDVDGNRLTLLPDGPDRLEALLRLIGDARRSLRLLFYIWQPDDAGRRVRDALVAAAGRGVAVSIVVDGLGSDAAVAQRFFGPLREAGATVCVFLPRFGRRYLLRNHQKLVLADERIAMIGGFNVEDDYFSTAEQKGWRDLGLSVDGPAAGRLAGYFDALAAWSARARPRLRDLSRLLKRWSEREGRVRWLLGGPSRRLSPWARTLRHELRHASAVDIIAAYFAPGPLMLRRLDQMAERGRLRILLPSWTDHDVAIHAQRFTYRNLLKHGAEIHEYRPTKLHTKLFVIDDAVHIGSANFDVRSMFLNMEIMLRVEDAAFAGLVRRYFEGEIAEADRITAEGHRRRGNWWARVRGAGAWFLLSWVDPQVTVRLNRR